MEWANAVYILLGGGLGGGVFKLVDILVSRKTNKEYNKISEIDVYSQIATQLRKELREDQKKLKIEVEKLRCDIEKWKKKYYDILDSYSEEKYKNNYLKEQVHELQVEVAELNQLKKIVRSIEKDIGKPISEIKPHEL